MLINPDLPARPKTRVSVERGAGALGCQPRIVQVRQRTATFDAVHLGSPPAPTSLLIVGSAFFFNHHARLAELTTRARVATIATVATVPRSVWWLMSYGADCAGL
jgi:hypothetical protein